MAQDQALIKRLIQNGAEIDLKFHLDSIRDTDLKSCLLCAIELGDLAILKTVIDSYCELHPDYSPVIPFDMVANQPVIYDYCIEKGFFSEWPFSEKTQLLKKLLLKEPTGALPASQEACLKKFVDEGVVLSTDEKAECFEAIIRSYKEKHLNLNKVYEFKHPSTLKGSVEDFFSKCDPEVDYVLLTQNEDMTLSYTAKNHLGKIVSGKTTIKMEENLKDSELPEIFFERFWYGIGGREQGGAFPIVPNSPENKAKTILMDKIYSEIQVQMVSESAKEMAMLVETQYEAILISRQKMIQKLTGMALPHYLQEAAALPSMSAPAQEGVTQAQKEWEATGEYQALQSTPEYLDLIQCLTKPIAQSSSSVDANAGSSIKSIKACLGDIIGNYIGPDADAFEDILSTDYAETQMRILSFSEPLVSLLAPSPYEDPKEGREPSSQLAPNVDEFNTSPDSVASRAPTSK